MSAAETPAVPRPRFSPPGGGRILTRKGLARMLAQVEQAARPRVQAEGAAMATGNSITYPEAGQDRTAQAALELRARQIQAMIPGRSRVITKSAFAGALRAFAETLGIPLDVDGADRVVEDADGGISLRLKRRAHNVFIFIEVAVFDDFSGDFVVPVRLAARYFPETDIFSTTSAWSATQMLELPDATPPNTRTIEVTYWARFRSASIAGDPDFDDANLVWLGDVELAMKKWNSSTLSVDTTFDVLINDPGGVTFAYFTTAPRSGDSLIATDLTVL